LAQRAALKFWWSRRPNSERGLTLDQFLSASERTKPHQHCPTGFCTRIFARASPAGAQSSSLRDSNPDGVFEETLPLSCLGGEGRGEASSFRLVHSLSQNFWIGLRAITNTWVLTLPACLLWWLAGMTAGTILSTKGMSRPVGPLISILGIVLFIAAMFYVPLAQARQAVTGEWRSFFQFRLVWRIVRLRWISSVGLALFLQPFGPPAECSEDCAHFPTRWQPSPGESN